MVVGRGIVEERTKEGEKEEERERAREGGRERGGERKSTQSAIVARPWSQILYIPIVKGGELSHKI